jgi:hypothetical protein
VEKGRRMNSLLKALLTSGMVFLVGCQAIFPSKETLLPEAATQAKASTRTARVEARFTHTPTQLISYTPTENSTAAVTVTPSPSLTPSRTPTPVQNPQLVVFIGTCNTSFDILNGLGEVTDAYLTIQNIGNRDATEVKATLAGSDEGKTHPDKVFDISVLPQGYQISIKLTVDTQNGIDTALMVEEVSTQAHREGCSGLAPDKDVLESMGELFQLRMINP